MGNYAIVTIGYNRPDCMMRLLNSLNGAYIDEDVPLIISLDNCGSNVVEEAVSSFHWKHGEKKIVTHEQRLGLKKHVLSIGEWTKRYEHIIVFEDDLFVSPFFFEYVKAAVEAYGDDDRIAGIGLYNQNLNQQCGYGFEAIDDGRDVYFMQYACSWGQVWSQKKWRAFMEWYADHLEAFDADPLVPQNVCRWNEKSWLKYHVRYCAHKGLFFVYPRISLTTNFSSAGSHAKFNDNAYQAAMLVHPKKWDMPSLDESSSQYNVFFENMLLYKHLALEENEVCIDTYGVRKNSGGKRYWLTTRQEGYKIVKSFGLELRPREANVVFNIPGEVIKLYDTACSDEVKALSEQKIDHVEMHYIVKATPLKKLSRYVVRSGLERVKQKIKQRKKKR